MARCLPRRKKGDRPGLCAAPFGPFRQTGPVPLFPGRQHRRWWLPLLAALVCMAWGLGLTTTARGSEVVVLPTTMLPGEPYAVVEPAVLAGDYSQPGEPGRFDLLGELPVAGERAPILLASNPEATTHFELSTEEKEEENIWDRPIDARNGFFQTLDFENTWLCGGSAPHALGEYQAELRGTFALPLPSRRHPLLLMPGFAVHWLEGPKAADLPPRLYDAYLQLRWLHKLSSRWSADLSVTPGVYSDFEQSSHEAIRTSGHFGAMWDWTPTTKIALGVVYLDRRDYRILPFAGMIWEPSPDVIFELMVPRPKIARRVYWYGAMTDDVQDWVYLAGEIGGGTWAMRRTDGTDDVVTYSDLRLILGLERKVLFGMDYRMEMAYVFARKLKYESAAPELIPSDTIMLRAGLTY